MKNVILYVLPKPSFKPIVYCFVGVEIDDKLYVNGVPLNQWDKKFIPQFIIVNANDTTDSHTIYPYGSNWDDAFEERIIRVNSRNICTDNRIIPIMLSPKFIVDNYEMLKKIERNMYRYLNEFWYDSNS